MSAEVGMIRGMKPKIIVHDGEQYISINSLKERCNPQEADNIFEKSAGLLLWQIKGGESPAEAVRYSIIAFLADTWGEVPAPNGLNSTGSKGNFQQAAIKALDAALKALKKIASGEATGDEAKAVALAAIAGNSN